MEVELGGVFKRLSLKPFEGVVSVEGVSSGPRGLRMTTTSFFATRWIEFVSELEAVGLVETPKILFRAT